MAQNSSYHIINILSCVGRLKKIRNVNYEDQKTGFFKGVQEVKNIKVGELKVHLAFFF